MNRFKCAVIDCDHILYTFLHGIKILDENQEPIKVDGKFTYLPKPFEQACAECDDYLHNILTKTGATYYIGFMCGSSAYRKSIYNEYKANRKDFIKPDNFEELIKYLQDNWNIINLRDIETFYETDDFVASFVRENLFSFIVSPDQDLLHLHTVSLLSYNPQKNEFIEEVTTAMAENYFFKDMICGQSSDNIKGLVGRGEKHYNLITQDLSPLDYKLLGTIIFEAYVGHFNYDYTKATNEWYKNYHCLKIKEDVDVSQFKPIEYVSNINDTPTSIPDSRNDSSF
jgi:5'-3' exonuclease